MNENLKAAFEECLAAFEQGASLEDSLQLHPEYTGELRPYMQAILSTHALALSIQVPANSQAHNRAEFLALSGYRPRSREWGAIIRAFLAFLRAR
jgi:hypothetical protein